MTDGSPRNYLNRWTPVMLLAAAVMNLAMAVTMTRAPARVVIHPLIPPLTRVSDEPVLTIHAASQAPGTDVLRDDHAPSFSVETRVMLSALAEEGEALRRKMSPMALQTMAVLDDEQTAHIFAWLDREDGRDTRLAGESAAAIQDGEQNS
ncbi:hypothetical protein JW905_05685 [bacterium]|nr:hypothetical protein [candidate division CSSED10-310 bacterium]